MIKKLSAVFIVLIVVVATMLWWGLATTRGGRFIAEKTFEGYTDDGVAEIDQTRGNFIEGITFNDLELNDIKALPAGSKLKIQRLFLSLKSLSPDGLVVEVENARLMLPASDPVVIAGRFADLTLDFNIFSRGFTVTEILGYLPDLKNLIPIKGEVNGLDVYIKGSYREPRIVGDFLIKEFVYEGFMLTETPCRVDVIFKDIKRDVKLFGRVDIGNGKLTTPKALINVASGIIDFSGPWDNPGFSLQGNARVERTKIAISLRGTPARPELTLTSEPPHSKEKLMIMLATGKSWRSVEGTMGSGMLSQDLTEDFIDYFLFAGRGNKFAEKFGVHDFTFTAEKNARGFGLKKDITDQLEIGYELQERSTAEDTKSVSQKIQGEYQLTDEIAVGAEKEVTREQKDDLLNSDPAEIKSNDKVYLKYQKSF